MKIVDVAIKQVYRFNCPNCGSKLEAEAHELMDIGGKTSEFYCPVCRCKRYISWRQLRNRVVYDEKGS